VHSANAMLLSFGVKCQCVAVLQHMVLVCCFPSAFGAGMSLSFGLWGWYVAFLQHVVLLGSLACYLLSCQVHCADLSAIGHGFEGGCVDLYRRLTQHDFSSTACLFVSLCCMDIVLVQRALPQFSKALVGVMTQPASLWGVFILP
jgi:hypothetical protein